MSGEYDVFILTDRRDWDTHIHARVAEAHLDDYLKALATRQFMHLTPVYYRRQDENQWNHLMLGYEPEED